MEEVFLKVPTIQDFPELAAYKAEFELSDDTLHGGAGLGQMSDLSAWLEHINAIAKGRGLEAGRVPSSTFICMRSSDNKMLGICNIRHSLDQPYLLNQIGHIGYSIRPSQRRKGYAKEQLRLALMEAGKLGISKVLVTCDENNLASEKTILANGGLYENDFYNQADNKTTKRFWIEVTQR